MLFPDRFVLLFPGSRDPKAEGCWVTKGLRSEEKKRRAGKCHRAGDRNHLIVFSFSSSLEPQGGREYLTVASMDSALSHSLASEDSDNELLEQRWPVKGLMYRHWKGCGTMQPSVQCMLALRGWSCSIIAALLRLISEDWDYAGVQRTKNDGIDVNMFLGTTMKRTKDIDGCNSQNREKKESDFSIHSSRTIFCTPER